MCVCHWFLFPRKSPPFPGFLDTMMVPVEGEAGRKKSPKLQICEIEIYKIYIYISGGNLGNNSGKPECFGDF